LKKKIDSILLLFPIIPIELFNFALSKSHSLVKISNQKCSQFVILDSFSLAVKVNDESLFL
jgi:hypothetical protein